MTLAGLVARNALRNKRRTVPTILSIAFSVLLLTIMMTLWRGFYIDQLGPASALRLFTRPPHVFFSYAMPSDYRQKIRAVPGVVAVAPLNLFNGVYKDNRPNSGFPQGGTDPEEFLKSTGTTRFRRIRSSRGRRTAPARLSKTPWPSS
jgi:putative ABC transport system permease protein